MKPTPTTSGICAMFGCTPDQVKAQYAKNVRTLEGITAKATARGKYRGMTAAQWHETTDKFTKTAKDVCAS